MTKDEITNKLITDVSMILRFSGAKKDATWKEIKKSVMKSMGTKSGSEKLIEAVSGATCSELSNEFIKGTANLLKYRIEKEDFNIPDKIKLKTEEMLLDDDFIIAELYKDLTTKKQESTITRYTFLEEAGSEEDLAEILNNKLGVNVKITTVPVTPGEFREKMNYMGHRIWAMSPNLPIVVVKLV